MEKASMKRHITMSLRIWHVHKREDIVLKAMAKIPLPHRAAFETAMKKPPRSKAAVAARAAEQATAQLWDTLLQNRVLLQAPQPESAKEQYRKRQQDDQRRVESKFREVLAAEDNTWRSARAVKFEEWCRSESWLMCETCHRMEKRPVRERHFTGKQLPHTMRKCKHCRDGTGYRTVQLEDIPDVLRALSPAVRWALRPLEPFTGKAVWAKHGYRVHTDMIRFWWRPESVENQIDKLVSSAERKAARNALRYLLASEESSYKKFHAMHMKVLRRNPDLWENDMKLQLPRRCLEEVGLECAVWPHLYPRTHMCETHIRISDTRRQQRIRRQVPPAVDSDSDNSNSEESESDDSEAVAPVNFAREARNSAKASYLAKVLGPVAEYGADYELFQFVYDLWLWSALGGKKNAALVPMRLAMAGYSFSPEYWHTRHAGLVDLVKQLGLPTLFLTIAPYEWTFPYHRWVEDEMEKQLRSKLHLPVAETLHIAHVLGETVHGFLTGANGEGMKSRAANKPWSSHVFSPKDGSGRDTVVNFFARLEFQDGKRKRYVNMQEVATQFYHGRGTVHVHMLLWLENVESIRLDQVLAATSPTDNEPLRSLVEGSQRSYSGGGWPVRDAASVFDADSGLVHLHHSAEDEWKKNAKGVSEGVRAYVVDSICSKYCHEDVQMSDGRGMLALSLRKPLNSACFFATSRAMCRSSVIASRRSG